MVDSYPAEGKKIGEGSSEQPLVLGAPVRMDYTTVTITTEPPKDHVIWSMVSLFFANILCLGLAAFICSIKSRDRKMVGDMVGAKHHGSKAFSLNVVNTVLAGMLLTAMIVSFFFNPMVSGIVGSFLIR